MGVLEARADAEKVGYSIIGEETKENSNVIDYNIQEEITKDKSAISNANNDTTTGMATVIPGVNAPKLKLSTSIYVDKLYIPYVKAILDKTQTINRPEDNGTIYRDMNIIESAGNVSIEYYDSPKGILYSGMKIPAKGYYNIDAVYPPTRTPFSYNVTYTFYRRLSKGGGSQDTILHTYTVNPGTQGNSTETFMLEFNKGDVLNIWCSADVSPSVETTRTPELKFTIQKIN